MFFAFHSGGTYESDPNDLGRMARFSRQVPLTNTLSPGFAKAIFCWIFLQRRNRPLRLPLPQYLVEPRNKSRQEKVAVRNLPSSPLTFLTPSNIQIGFCGY